MWSAEDVTTLKTLARRGLSAAQIGAKIGVTKNAVIGKCHRVGLKLKRSPGPKIKRRSDAVAEANAILIRGAA